VNSYNGEFAERLGRRPFPAVGGQTFIGSMYVVSSSKIAAQRSLSPLSRQRSAVSA
jgi:hypothetical protein